MTTTPLKLNLDDGSTVIFDHSPLGQVVLVNRQYPKKMEDVRLLQSDGRTIPVFDAIAQQHESDQSQEP